MTERKDRDPSPMPEEVMGVFRELVPAVAGLPGSPAAAVLQTRLLRYELVLEKWRSAAPRPADVATMMFLLEEVRAALVAAKDSQAAPHARDPHGQGRPTKRR